MIGAGLPVFRSILKAFEDGEDNLTLSVNFEGRSLFASSGSEAGGEHFIPVLTEPHRTRRCPPRLC